MRPERIGRLLDRRKLQKLRQDFRTPVRALIASSGVVGGQFELKTRAGDIMTVDRGDLPIWEEYFNARSCEVQIDQGLFHIRPFEKQHPDYFIKGASQGMTWQPTRWSGSEAPLIQHLQSAEKSICSQHGEDGVIQALLEKIPPVKRFVVEFGAYDGEYMSNSRHLIRDHGWQALLIEADPRFYRDLQRRYAGETRVKTVKAFLTPENINQVFAAAGVPETFDVLSIDVDGPDFYLWQALTEFRAQIVITEYNSSIPPPEEYIAPLDKMQELNKSSKYQIS